VDYDRRNRTDWYRLQLPEAGHLTLSFRPVNVRARVRADLGRTPVEAETGARRLAVGTQVVADKGAWYVRVQAEGRGDATPYVLEAELRPATWLEAAVVEIDRAKGCAVTVDKGERAGVRAGAAANILVGGQVAGAAVVEQVFPMLARVKVLDGDCRLQGAKVQIMSGN
jgi:hypothetical protein